MRHVKEDTRHDVDQEIASDRCPAQAKDREHEIEDQHQHHGLQQVHGNRHEGVVVGLPNAADDGVIDDFTHRQRTADAGLWLTN